MRVAKWFNKFIILFILVSFSTTVLAEIIAGLPELVSQKRVTRTQYEYTYKLNISNVGGDKKDITAIVTSSKSSTVIIDNELTFENLAEGESTLSSDTFSIRQDRRVPTGNSISYEFSFTDVQPPPPATVSVQITSPQSLTTLGVSPVAVTGTVSPVDAKITLNGVEITNNMGDFSGNVALEEGKNSIEARASKNGVIRTDSISISLDLTPPQLTIDSHKDNDTVFTETVTITGLVNDIVRGTIEQSEANVTVNGVAAEIANRSYAVRDLPVAVGQNLITIAGSDQVGNTAQITINLNREEVIGKRLELFSGQGQTAMINELLTEPLVVRVLDDNDAPVNNAAVIFRVKDGSGAVAVGTEEEGRAVVVETDAEGKAQTEFKLGARVGTANHKVNAAVVGFDGEVVFNASATGQIGNKLSVNSGNNQRGAVGQVLPEPLVVVVTDEGANVVKDARIRFDVTKGGGKFSANELQSIEALTDSDGRATTEFILGDLEGLDAQRIIATLLDAPVGQIITAGFTASALLPVEGADTTVSGVVLDNQDTPIPGVTVRVEGTNRQSITNDNGIFIITESPVGPIHLIADGSTATLPGEFPSLSYNLVTISGVDNPLSAPIYMVKLDTDSSVFAGNEDVDLTLPEFPGFKLSILKDSVTFPDGSREGLISVTAVNASKVPMAPPNGMQPQFIVTVQPTGALFDPPAQLSLPNVDGHAPGAQVEMYSYDHDLEEFVTIGLGTVSENGSVVTSDPGVGVIKAGWHCGSQPGGAGCTHNCPICQDCDGDCNCVPVSGDPRLAPLNSVGDCKKSECQNGSAVQVNDDSDIPDTSDVKGDCKMPGCENGTPKDVDDDADISDDDVKCKKCENGDVVKDPAKDTLKCGDGSSEQACLECKDGNCQHPECMAKGELVSLAIGTEIDPTQVPGLGKIVSAVNKALALLPVKCDIPTVAIKGFYKNGDECCQDCNNFVKEGSRYHQVGGGGEISSDCVIGKKAPPLDINWPITAFGYGIQVEIKGEATVGITFKPSFSIEASGKYNLTCEEGCVSGEAKLAFPVFGGIIAKIRKAEAEVKFGSFGDLDIAEISGSEITGGLSVGTISGAVSAGIGSATGCDSLNCKLTLGDGKLVFTFKGGTLQLLDRESLTLNLSEYINWELEVPLWSGKELSCK